MLDTRLTSKYTVLDKTENSSRNLPLELITRTLENFKMWNVESHRFKIVDSFTSPSSLLP